MYLDVTETANIVRFPLIKQFSKPSAFGRLCNDDYSKRPIELFVFFAWHCFYIFKRGIT